MNENATKVADFTKHVLVGYENIHNGKREVRAPIFATIEWKAGRLSITAVVGPLKNGDALGSCGQCLDSVRDCEPADGFPRDRFLAVWERWHLNDMRDGTPAQEAHLRTLTFPGYPLVHYDWARDELGKVGLQPDNGYSYGSQWLREEVPADVIEFLTALPANNGMPPCWLRS